MKNLACFFGLVTALCLGLPATGFSHHDRHDHGGWHGRSYYGSHFHYYGPYFPYFAAYPYYGYYGAPDYDASYGGPSFNVSTSVSPTYRGTRADDRGDDLAIEVQRALRRDGYYRGSIDGDIGSGTRGAIRQYQYDHHLEVTGRIDRALLQSLDLD